MATIKHFIVATTTIEKRLTFSIQGGMMDGGGLAGQGGRPCIGICFLRLVVAMVVVVMVAMVSRAL